ncbi:MAG: SUMF1/EgtB/PvdO family nonheme iron enzyme, partial [Planctomycetota bacterium]
MTSPIRIENVETSHVLPELERAWKRTDELYALLDPRALPVRSISLRHPFIFYLGHLPAFAWNQIARGVLNEPSFHPHFDDLFERGIDPLDDHSADAVRIDDWPEVSEIEAYRDEVRVRLRECVAKIEAQQETSEDPLLRHSRIVHLVIEHELMHHETLLYLIQELQPELKRAPEGYSIQRGSAGTTDPETVRIPQGSIRLGANFDEIPFGWDNEFPEQTIQVPSFEVDTEPVSIARFLEFVESGAYDDRQYWGRSDWNWKTDAGVTHPRNWRKDETGTWRRRTMFGEVPLVGVSAWPVIVSQAEALAYTRWKGARLPFERELQRATYATHSGAAPQSERLYPWGDDAPRPEHGNFGGRSFDPVPIGTHTAGASAFGVLETVGNGWEWTNSEFAPFQ